MGSATPRTVARRRRHDGRQYLDFAESRVDVEIVYADGVWGQPAGIRSAVDPHGTFVANHPVPWLFEEGAAPA